MTFRLRGQRKNGYPIYFTSSHRMAHSAQHASPSHAIERVPEKPMATSPQFCGAENYAFVFHFSNFGAVLAQMTDASMQERTHKPNSRFNADSNMATLAERDFSFGRCTAGHPRRLAVPGSNPVRRDSTEEHAF